MTPTQSVAAREMITTLHASRPYDGRRVTLCEKRGGWRFQGITGVCLRFAEDRKHMVIRVEHDPDEHWPVGMEILAELDHESVPDFE